MRWRSKVVLVFAVLVVLVYVGSYIWLSRQGYAEADKYNVTGFYYFRPEASTSWRLKNYGCGALFAPLNAIDRALGWGREIASEPLIGLSKD